jgi:hypothetical protein
VSKPFNPPTVGVILPCFPSGDKEFLRAVKSLLSGSVLPWYVIVLDYGSETRLDARSFKEAMALLEDILPNVELRGYHHFIPVKDPLAAAMRDMIGMGVEVLVNMSSEVVLKRHGLNELTYAFVRKDLTHVRGDWTMIEKPKPWYRFLWWWMRRKVGDKLLAYSRETAMRLLDEGVF